MARRANDDAFNGTSGDDDITVTNGTQTDISTFAGDDILRVEDDGDFRIDLGFGDDTVILDGTGDSSVFGGGGADVAQAGAGESAFFLGIRRRPVGRAAPAT